MALKKAVIHVKKCDIRNGVKGECSKCPIALAMIRKFNIQLPKKHRFQWPSVTVGVLNASFRLVKEGPKFAGELPARAVRFIDAFDEDSKEQTRLKPFKFKFQYQKAK